MSGQLSKAAEWTILLAAHFGALFGWGIYVEQGLATLSARDAELVHRISIIETAQRSVVPLAVILHAMQQDQDSALAHISQIDDHGTRGSNVIFSDMRTRLERIEGIISEGPPRG